MSLLSVYQPNAPSQVTSTSTSDVKTVVPPAGAKGFYIACATNNCRITLDGTTVSSTVGLPIQAASNPQFFPFDVATSGLQIVSTAAGNSVVDVMFGT